MVRFRMCKINVVQFAILSEEPKADLLGAGVRIGFDVSEDQRIASDVRITFEEEKTPILVLEISCEFEIHPEDWGKMRKKKKMVIPKSTLELLAAQTVGTTRGVLHCKTEGTPLSSLIMPPINVAAMIDSDISIDIVESKDNTK